MIGTSIASHSEQTIIEVEFYDYLGNPLVPTKNVVLNDSTEEEFDVNVNSTAHKIGKAGNNDYYARWHVEDNKLLAVGGKTTAATLLTQIYYFQLLELQTNEKSYTKFKFIQ